MRKRINMKIAVITGKDRTRESLAVYFTHATGCTFYADAKAVDKDADAIIDFSFTGTTEEVEQLRSFLPRTVIVNSVLHTTSETDDSFIRFNGWPGLFNITAVEAFIPATHKEKADEVFGTLQWNYIHHPDNRGFTTPRVVSMIINEAFFAFGEGVSTKEEIDTAMKLGTNYPHGPFEWCHIIGAGNIYMLLKKLYENDARYLPAPLLEKEAANF